MKTYVTQMALIVSGVTLLSLCPQYGAAAEGVDAERAQLQRHYAMRVRFEQERRNRDNEARVSSPVQGPALGTIDNPSVTQMRVLTTETVRQLGDQWICNDIDVNNESGNTTIVCGSQTGDVRSSRTVVGGDLIQVGGAP